MTTHFLLLVFLLITGLWILRKRKRSAAFLFVKINVLIFTCFLILYAPILLATGFSVFKSVINLAPPYYTVIMQLPYVMRGVLMDYTGNSYTSMIVFLAAIVIILLLKNKLPGNRQFILLLAVGLTLSTVLFYLFTRFPYAGRSLAFGSLSIPLLTCLFVQMAQPWLDRNNARKNTIGIVAIGSVFLLDSYFLFPVHPIDKFVAVVSRLLIDKKITTCYDNSSHASRFYYYYPGIEYYYRLENKTIEFTLVEKNSMRYKLLLPGNNYDCIVYDANASDSSRAGAYHETYRDPNGKFKIWMRNDVR